MGGCHGHAPFGVEYDMGQIDRACTGLDQLPEDPSQHHFRFLQKQLKPPSPQNISHSFRAHERGP